MLTIYYKVFRLTAISPPFAEGSSNPLPKNKPLLSTRSETFYARKDKIFQFILVELGYTKFLKLARQREMLVGDSELENIEEQYSNVQRRIEKVLNLACERNSLETFPGVLLNSLEKAGHLRMRNDIERLFL